MLGVVVVVLAGVVLVGEGVVLVGAPALGVVLVGVVAVLVGALGYAFVGAAAALAIGEYAVFSTDAAEAVPPLEPPVVEPSPSVSSSSARLASASSYRAA